MTTTIPAVIAEHVSREELDRLLVLQRAAFRKEGAPSAEVRRNRIDRLTLAVLEASDEIADALAEDYGQRPRALTKAFEIASAVGEAELLRANLEEWMKPEPVEGPVPAFIQQKPLGVVGVITAWNFPVTLSVKPALDALAAGNRVIIKFTDVHVRTGQVFARALARHLAEDEVAVVCSDLKTAQEFSDLPLDHILFTGSPAVGKLVAAAAGKNLVPVTLELGGKNPVVVAPDADLDVAAHRIAVTRMVNGGQICMCPDYVFVPREAGEEFVGKLRACLARLFPVYVNSPAAVSIVNDRNYDRVLGLVEDAVARGARKVVAVDEEPSRERRLIPPTILLDVPEDAEIAGEEIFGPVLPVYFYDTADEPIDYVNGHPSPLCAYWYGEDSPGFHRFLDSTTSGGVTRNDGFLHSTVHAPFGGSATPAPGPSVARSA